MRSTGKGAALTLPTTAHAALVLADSTEPLAGGRSESLLLHVTTDSYL